MVDVIKFETDIADDGISDALRQISVARAKIPLILIKNHGVRIQFITYFIRYEDPVYEKVKDESPESMVDACQPVYFSLRKDCDIYIPLLVQGIKTKVKGKIRKQLQEIARV